MTDASQPIEPNQPSEPQSILKPRTRIGVRMLAIAGVFGLLFAYFVWQAVKNLVELPKSYDAIGLGDSVPWVLLVVGLLLPVILYVVAFAVAMRLRTLDKAVVFFMALATAAAFSYGVVAVHRLTFDALLASL